MRFGNILCGSPDVDEDLRCSEQHLVQTVTPIRVMGLPLVPHMISTAILYFSAPQLTPSGFNGPCS